MKNYEKYRAIQELKELGGNTEHMERELADEILKEIADEDPSFLKKNNWSQEDHMLFCALIKQGKDLSAVS